jgi:hypothetical protein
MTLQAATDTTCNTCRKPILNRRSSLQTKCAPCVYKAANARDKELRKAQRQATVDARKKDAADTRARRVALKSRRDWLNDAQTAFNKWTRIRDADERCISCGKLAAAWGSWDAGHYLTVGARPELRFNPDNCHKQCVKCNQHLHGNTAMYRIGLVARIGLAAVEALEGPHPQAHWSVDDLRAIKTKYRAMARELTKEAA